jgi:transposase
MNQSKRNEIIGLWQAGCSIRKIARELGLARNTVSSVLGQVQAQRAGVPPGSTAAKRPSRLDPYEPIIQDLLSRYPDLTAVRLLEELRQRGFAGGYTVVRQRLAQLRVPATPQPVVRFETAPGLHYGKSGVMCGALRWRAYLR